MQRTPIISQERPVPTLSPGIADIVGFSPKGVIVMRNSVNLQPLLAISDFGSEAGGWMVDKHVRLMGDSTGNGANDIIGFGTSGVWIGVNNGNNTFHSVKLVLKDFGLDQGWQISKHLRFVADLRKTGKVDLIGFGGEGISVSLNNGHGAYAPAKLVLKDFGYAQGWRLERHLRFLADVTGDRRPDIIGFGEKHVFIARANSDGTFQAPQSVLSDLCAGAGGWAIDRHPRAVADLTGDNKADIIGFGNAGVYVALNKGDGTFAAPKLVLGAFGYSQGWRVPTHPRFVVDLNGNGRADIIGFANDGVWVALGKGDGTFHDAKHVLADFGAVAGGWKPERHLRFMADMTGDGCADIVGFGESALLVSYNDGKGNYGPVQRLTSEFAYNNGQWTLDKTVRYPSNLYL